MCIVCGVVCEVRVLWYVKWGVCTVSGVSSVCHSVWIMWC